MLVAPGVTSFRFDFDVFGDDGAGRPGLLAADFPDFYVIYDNNSVLLPLVDLALITDAWTEGGLIERAAGGGAYRVDLPNAPFGANRYQVKLKCEGPNFHLIHEPIQLIQFGLTVVPTVGNSPEQQCEILLTALSDADVTFSVTLRDPDNVIIDPTTLGPLVIKIEDDEKRLIQTILDAAIAKTSTSIQFTTLRNEANKTAFAGGEWAVRQVSSNYPFGHGEYVVKHTAN